MKTSLPKVNSNLTLDKSQSLSEKSRQYIAGFTQSMMKKPQQFAMGHFPVYLDSGNGALVKDIDGNEYIDFICGLAANTLGHNHPVLVNAIQNNLHKGVIHSLPTPIEVRTAKTLIDMIPGAEMARFFKTGADANSAAVRLARYATGKEHIVTVGYNGWHDQYQFDTPGVPSIMEQMTHRMPLFSPNDEQALLDLIKDKANVLASVVLSVPYNRVLSTEFMLQLRETCTDSNVLLIFDEVVTGFRLALGGAQAFFGITADLTTLSKGIAAGMPLSAVVGKKSLMAQMDNLQVSTTFGGEMLSLEVCNAVLQEYTSTDYIQRIATLGRRLKQGVNSSSKALGTSLKVVGYDPIPMFLFCKNPAEHAKIAEKFLAQMAKRGVLLRRDVNFICSAHTEEQIDFTISAIRSALREMISRGELLSTLSTPEEAL